MLARKTVTFSVSLKLFPLDRDKRENKTALREISQLRRCSGVCPAPSRPGGEHSLFARGGSWVWAGLQSLGDFITLRVMLKVSLARCLV